jgi:dihydrofolate reductase
MTIIAIHFSTLDGIVSDPDGTDGTATGGWAFRHGREVVAGDKFQLGATMDEGVLLLGRATWQHFARLWPNRDDPFAIRMNAVPKLVATTTLTDLTAWGNSSRLAGDLVAAVRAERRDVIVVGSLSITHALMSAQLVDEWRLLTFPTIVGTGRRLFPEGTTPMHLACQQAEQTGPAVLTRWTRADR